MEYDNNMSGVLFKNDKATNERAPGYTGKVNINGKDYRLAAWVKEGKNGKFFSLKVSEFENKEMPKPKPAPQVGFDDLDDDIPF
jgi:hypothetical protein